MIGIQMGDEPNTDYGDGFKKGQARERAAWRKAVKRLERPKGGERYDDVIYNMALADLLAAMKRRKG